MYSIVCGAASKNGNSAMAVSSNAITPHSAASAMARKRRVLNTSSAPYATPTNTICSADSGWPTMRIATNALVSTTAARTDISYTTNRTPTSTSGNTAHARPSGQPTKNAITPLNMNPAAPISAAMSLSPSERAKTNVKKPARKNVMAAPNVIACGCLRSEEHTSELQSQSNLVCRLLLEKK